MALTAAASGLRELIARARALVFDFDGTLVDSNPIKFRAFERCFADLDERREEVLAYCLGHHHVPRSEKFRHVYERILERPYTDEVARRLHARFELATTDAIIRAPATPGAEDFLAALRGRMTALLSSTPHDVLLRILAGRGWPGFFSVVQGAPVAKAEWLRAFCADRGLPAERVLFFGDTPEDRAAARAAGCRFIAVRSSGSGRGGALADFTSLGVACLR